jgi:hypothetical protein
LSEKSDIEAVHFVRNVIEDGEVGQHEQFVANFLDDAFGGAGSWLVALILRDGCGGNRQETEGENKEFGVHDILLAVEILRDDFILLQERDGVRGREKAQAPAVVEIP